MPKTNNPDRPYTNADYMEIYSLETGNLMLDGGALFGVVPKTIWGRLYPADENNLCNLSMRSLLIKEGKRNVLIDCGMGDKMDPSLQQYYFLNGEDTLLGSLAKTETDPEDITDVVLTHLHFDHCGGAVRSTGTGLELVFANAQHWIGKRQWDVALSPNRRERASFFPENFKPIENAGKLKLIDADFALTDHIYLRQFHGHTEGQIIAEIDFFGKTLVYVADFIPTSAHIPISFVCGYDVQPLVTMQETQTYLETAVEKGYTLFFEHDIDTECCSLERGKRGVQKQRNLNLEEFLDLARMQ